MKPFFDTNVLVYAADTTGDARAARAHALVRQALSDNVGAVSTQVLQEFYSVSTRKMHTPPAIARQQVERLSSLHVVQVTVPLILAAADLHAARQVAFWDALVIRAAQAAGCDELWTEDLQAGAVYDGVQVVNPFA